MVGVSLLLWSRVPSGISLGVNTHCGCIDCEKKSDSYNMRKDPDENDGSIVMSASSTTSDEYISNSDDDDDDDDDNDIVSSRSYSPFDYDPFQSYDYEC